MRGSRKLIALLSLVVLLFAVLAPHSQGVPAAWFAPFWLFLAILICFSVASQQPLPHPRPFPFVTILLSRAPPTA